MEIQQSHVEDLRQRVLKRNYRKYLSEMKIVKVRGLNEQTIRFDFPVTAIIGTNGGGKSTVLGAAAIAYKSVRPGEFFPKSNVGDVSMSNWRVEYQLVDKDVAGSTARNARFVAAKWRRDELLDRDVVYFPIMRTVPAGEQTRYKKFIGIYKLDEPYIEPLPPIVARAAGRILGRELSGYATARISEGDAEYIFLGQKSSDGYSQFHFGAGEASIIEMVSKIEKSEDFSLIVIEELENGLHPLATELMVEYLIDVAYRKKSQVIFTTHSEYALKKLPSEAKWAAVDGELYQGHLNIDSLRALTGTVVKDQVIFVEDAFAKDWVEDIIRQYCPERIFSTEVHSAGGYPFVETVTIHHNDNPTTNSRAIAIIDGDAAVSGDLKKSIYRLPGGIP